MDAIQIQCPTCHAQFVVPGEFVNRRARCKRCGEHFVIEPPSMEDTVAGWLNEDVPAPAAAAAGVAKSAPVTAHAAAGSTAKPTTSARPHYATPGPGDTQELEPQVDPAETLRLSHVDELGAFFLFSPALLTSISFRSSIPRCCLGCGASDHLHAHLVRWQSVRNDRGQSLGDADDVRTKILADDLIGLNDEQLLEALPRVPNSPPPFDLPIPYFICNRCSPVGAIMTHVRPTPDGDEVCELGIASLKRAAQFLARNLGRDHVDYKRLADEIRSGRANPWNSLPLAVRNRIVRWYDSKEDETFISYIRDTDFAKAEAGLGGLVITNKRIVFQKFASHRELPLSKMIELTVANGVEQYQLTLTTQGVKPAVLNCDPTVTEAIRKALRSVDAKYRLSS